jgi:hypothetical protein
MGELAVRSELDTRHARRDNSPTMVRVCTTPNAAAAPNSFDIGHC